MSITNALTPAAAKFLFQRAIVFIDGSALFCWLEAAKLRLNKPTDEIFSRYVEGRGVQRILMYTVREKLEKALSVHGDLITHGVRIVQGDFITTSKGPKEKCVDALLVADLVYHAAARNMDYALIVTADTDFRHVIRRVEDFGCRTGAMSLCVPLPDRLREACDHPTSLSRQDLLNLHLAVEL